MSRRSIAFAVLTALCAFGARAQEPIYGPDGAPTVVQRKLHPISGRWELAASFDVALNGALVDQLGGAFGVFYHPNEWLDLGAEALVHHAALTDLTQDIRSKLRPRIAGALRDEFRNDNQLRAGAFGVARFAPIYGKLNLFGDLKVHFQAFLLGGAGAAEIHRESVNLCADAGTGTCQSFQTTDTLRPVALIGAGFRFYLGQRWSVRTEVRGHFFPTSYKVDNDVTDPSSGRSVTYLGAIATFDAGLSFLF
jgi:outer membrane beta-barrel protein